jgi:clorobiocin biosynthesis protein CloN7
VIDLPVRWVSEGKEELNMAKADSTTRILDVPGARLYYEIRGSGPLLLLIGSPMGSRGFASLASLLADDYTIVTYDPRGILPSTIEDPDQDATPELLADDVHRLLSALGRGPAYLFGNSGGAVTGLALIARHPGQVRTFIAHEPPLVEPLPDRWQIDAALGKVCDTYASKGPVAAANEFMDLSRIRFAQPPGGGQSWALERGSFTPPADVWPILDRFFRHIVRPTALYRPDLTALRAASTRIVVAGGTTSKGELYHRTAVALAYQLGTTIVDFPGGHTGFQGHPEPFARLLRKVLTETT